MRQTRGKQQAEAVALLVYDGDRKRGGGGGSGGGGKAIEGTGSDQQQAVAL